MVLDEWLLFQGDANWKMPEETRNCLAGELARLAAEAEDGHLNCARIQVDETDLSLSLNDDNIVQDEYASPELLEDRDGKAFPSAAFSFGVLLDEFRRGATYWSECEWNTSAFLEVLERDGDAWLPVEADDPLAGVIRACTAVRLEDRPQTLQELAALLAEAGVSVAEAREKDEAEDGHAEEPAQEDQSASFQEDSGAQDEPSEEPEESGEPEPGSAEDEEPAKEAGVTVGIDLGTSYSTVAYYQDGRLHFLEIRRKKSTPSAIFFDDAETQLFGEMALRKGVAYPESLFKHLTRHIGEEKTFPFVCHDKNRKPKTNTFIIDTNAFLNDPQILDGIAERHKVIVPMSIYEELNYHLGKEETKYQAKAAISSIDEKKDRIMFEASDMDLLPQDFFRSHMTRTLNDRNDNSAIAIALAHDDADTVIITDDKGIHQKVEWLQKEQGAQFCTMKLKEFQFVKTAKMDDVADLQLTGKDGAVLFLKYLRQEMEKKLGGSVSRAVITVPELFSPFQKDKTKEAALAAGFSEVELQTEPIAAAVAYGLDQEEEKNLLVYDFGGGTFDVAIIRKDSDGFHRLGAGGDPALGGEDFTQLLVEEFEDRLNQMLEDQGEDVDMMDEETSGLSHEEYCKNREQIWSNCEALKCALSESEKEEVAIRVYTKPGSKQEVPFALSREEFEDITAGLVERSRKALDEALSSAHLTRDAIDVVILAGGTSTIPCIRTLVEHYFGSKTPVMKDRDTATLIAAGAAAFADRKWNPESTIHQRILVYEKTIDDLGVAYKRDSSDLHYRFGLVIPAEKSLPCQSDHPCEYSLPQDGTEHLSVFFYKRKAGSTSEMTTDADMDYIGKVEIDHLPPLKQSDAVVQVMFSLTKEYLLDATVTVRDGQGNEVRTKSAHISKAGV